MSEPLVMCLTNTVAANFTANVLLAIGAKPAMIEEPSEAAQLAAAAGAVLVNVGTIDERQAAVMRAAIAVCREKKVQWVLDPVAAHLLAFRAGLIEEFLSSGPSMIRGNRDEIEWLRGRFNTDAVLLATGERDEIYAAGATPRIITGGVPMLQRVTATGCAQGAICAAFLAAGKSPVEAAVSASRLMKTAGEIAWEKSEKPGSFKTALIDALYQLTEGKIR